MRRSESESVTVMTPCASRLEKLAGERGLDVESGLLEKLSKQILKQNDIEKTVRTAFIDNWKEKGINANAIAVLEQRNHVLRGRLAKLILATSRRAY